MSTALLQQHVSISNVISPTKSSFTNTKKSQKKSTTTTTKSIKSHTMAWSNEKLRFSCIENIGLKQLWKLIAMDTTTTTKTTAAAAATNTTAATTTTAATIEKNLQQNNNSNKLKKSNQSRRNSISQNNCKHFEQQHEKNEKSHFENCVNLADYLTNRDILTPSSMSLLKFLAINALELSAPATPVLLQQNQQKPTEQAQQPVDAAQQKQQQINPQGWMQLSGHAESIVPTTSGIVRKRVSSLTSDSEVLAYQLLSRETQTAQIVPHFYGTRQIEKDAYIELEDLLAGFKDPCVMDIKLGCRTFLESEVTNKTQRADLYQKMVAVDANAPTPAEHEAQAITKLRYMLFREEMSSSHTKGFRIEALRLRGRPPIKDLKTVRSSEQIAQTIEQFVGGRHETHKALIQRLKQIRAVIEQSAFFQRHEIVGSSIFIVYDDAKVGAWLIDFAKSRQLPVEICVNHRADWVPGNREEGLLKGMDELIEAFENVYAGHGSRKCLHI